MDPEVNGLETYNDMLLTSPQNINFTQCIIEWNLKHKKLTCIIQLLQKLVTLSKVKLFKALKIALFYSNYVYNFSQFSWKVEINLKQKYSLFLLALEFISNI